MSFFLLFSLCSAALSPGQVFGLIAKAPDSSAHDRPIYVYSDNTLGLHDPFNDVPQFQGVLMPEYGIIVQPEPCMVVKTSERSILTVHDSLYNPTVGFYESDGLLKPVDGASRFVICPTWNEVLLVDDGKAEICSDAIEVELEVTAS